jgi:hypothetical protein
MGTRRLHDLWRIRGGIGDGVGVWDGPATR